MSILIRMARDSDLADLALIEKECFSEPWSIDSFMSEFASENSVFIAAEDESGVICGFVTASFVLDEININNVAVRTEYRKCGIGTALLEKLDEYAAEINAGFINLEVRESNIPAVDLYKKLGYVQVGLRKNFYCKPDENAILMTKYLTDE